TRLLRDPVHVRADAGGLAEADGMDFIGGEVRGRLLPDAESVIFAAARLGGDAVRLGAMRRILGAIELRIFGVSGVEDGSDVALRADLERGPLLRGDVRRAGA